MVLIPILAFLILQTLINVLINLSNIDTMKRVMVGLGDIIFGILMFFNPITPIFLYFYLDHSYAFEGCANIMIGPALLQWFVGIPSVIFLQKFLNKQVFKMRIEEVL